MKLILHRYLVKEQLIPMGVCLMGLSLILIMGRILQLARYLFTTSLTFLDLIELMALALPKLALFALPMATLIGVLLAFARLNGDNELVACRAAGISFAQFLPSVLLVLIPTVILSFCNALFIIPAANQAFDLKIKSLGRTSVHALLREGTFITSIPKMVFFLRKVDPSNLTFEGLFVQDQRQPNIRIIIVAEKGQVSYDSDFSHLVFKISEGNVTRVPDDLKDAQTVSFKNYDLSFSLDELLGGTGRTEKSRREMTLLELYRMIQSGSGKDYAQYALELHQRLALPLACLLLGFAGAPLGAMFRRTKGATAGVMLGLLVFLAYYVLLSGAKGLGKNGLLSPFIATWTPNLLTLAFACCLWVVIHKERMLGLEAFANSCRRVWQEALRRVRIRKQR